jgi:hypothetical protein
MAPAEEQVKTFDTILNIREASADDIRKVVRLVEKRDPGVLNDRETLERLRKRSEALLSSQGLAVAVRNRTLVLISQRDAIEWLQLHGETQHALFGALTAMGEAFEESAAELVRRLRERAEQARKQHEKAAEIATTIQKPVAQKAVLPVADKPTSQAEAISDQSQKSAAEEELELARRAAEARNKLAGISPAESKPREPRERKAMPLAVVRDDYEPTRRGPRMLDHRIQFTGKAPEFRNRRSARPWLLEEAWKLMQDCKYVSDFKELVEKTPSVSHCLHTNFLNWGVNKGLIKLEPIEK